jgi:hypothetical protein
VYRGVHGLLYQGGVEVPRGDGHQADRRHGGPRRTE